ncbi:site-specific integrase [Nonomuraea dietziae]|uniref:site-specific integrase n=1 Tax=Nonomuraea dietziae TaxID=65515 RepID=UPI0033FA6E82
MRVQRVLMPGTEAESWTLLGDDHVPVEPVERFLAYLASIEKSPNTLKAYAHDLKDWFTYLAGHRLDWKAVTVEDVAGFVAWLRLPPEGRDGKVAILPTVEHHCSAASVRDDQPQPSALALRQRSGQGRQDRPVRHDSRGRFTCRSRTATW